MSQDQAAHHAEQIQIQRDIENVIEAAQLRPITKDESRLVAWACGVSIKETNLTTKENQNGKYQ